MGRDPRDYQLECRQACRPVLQQHQSAMIVLPTGTGKTVVMSHQAVDWIQEHSTNVLVVAERIQLLDQAAEKFAGELGYMPPIIQGDRTYDFSQGGLFGSKIRCAIACVPTLRQGRRLETFKGWPIGLMMTDECHHGGSRQYWKVRDRLRQLYPEMRELGVTATPNKKWRQVYETIAYQRSIAEMIEAGWLVPITHKFLHVDGVDFEKVRHTVNKLGERDLSEEDLEAIFQEENPCYGPAKAFVDEAGDRRGLIFMPGVGSAYVMAAVINRYAERHVAVAIDGSTHVDVRRDIYRRFEDGAVQFLVSCDVITEGFDAPHVSFLGMCRATESEGRYKQMLGRGLRPLAGWADAYPYDPMQRRAAIAVSPKPDCLVLDVVGNSEHARSLYTAIDVMGEDFDDEVRSRFKGQSFDDGATTRSASSNAELKKMKAAVLAQREIDRRKPVRPSVAYRTEALDPHGVLPTAGSGALGRGSVTDAQIGLLVGLGVTRTEASTYSKKQAGAVIGNLQQRRCTQRQAFVLARNGLDPTTFNFFQASDEIDRIRRRTTS